MKKLTRSRDSKVLSGVLGGIGEYLHIDPTVIRILFVFLLLVTGVFPFVILYVLAAVILPEAPRIIPSRPIVEDPITDGDISV